MVLQDDRHGSQRVNNNLFVLNESFRSFINYLGVDIFALTSVAVVF